MNDRPYRLLRHLQRALPRHLHPPNPLDHHSHPSCLREAFLLATRNESLHPPRCNGTAIPLSLARPHLSLAEQEVYERKTVEFGTFSRVYCSKVACEEFLGSTSDASVALKCGKCGTTTCGVCRASWHGETGVCGAAKDEEVVAVLARDFKYQRCPSCRRVVERASGCPHMCVFPDRCSLDRH